MTTSRLAPYMGWGSFEERAKDNWLRWKKAAGFTHLSRVGLRYLND